MTRHILPLVALLVSATVSAQTITFDTQDFKSLGAYDTWPESPFRTGQLKPNVAVVDNHLADSINSSSKILGIQRSRYGSNTFGAEIALNSPWRVGTTPQYVHVLLHKPVDSRVMLIGLGNRSDRPGQSPRVEQFWVYPLNDLAVGEWVDAVFLVKTNDGVDIHSLVLAPDLRSDCKEDFIAYIDNIEINDDRTPRTGAGDYPINLPSQTMVTRYDRYLRGVCLDNDTIPVNTVRNVHVPLYTFSPDKIFAATAGQTVKPAVDYEGDWMNAYVYLDRNNDGMFSSDELVSNSRTGGERNLDTPAFTVPADLTPGIYRMRYKVDWDNTDPGGDSQSIATNGGAIADVLLNVHAAEVTVNNDNRNGEVLLADGRSLDNISVPFGRDLKLKAVPSNGFKCNGVKVRHGYHLSGEPMLRSNRQYREDIIPASSFAPDGTITIPASMVDGNLLIEGLFVSTNN